ncbi:uncharacterized protein LAESUDRAFT_740869 [Laetiporus sulphureus 93-53]|uniref:Vacuolar import and degradation protein n=1 Tax=Laetiporus sulphureus 93-53 TaxID=1314785 RepID=A0A165H7B2_9APHY|nr:uncharacterized protein LAESUDRAFT_740869 [Laetiporus sulphureus 93-53]KZT11344.1 hypothetical protein LAESUDRAFT_740869 [Laetiporus sulphureus 93-53]
MPSEQPAPTIHDQTPPEQPQGQVKLCTACHCPLSADSVNTSFVLHSDTDPNEAGIVCGPCSTRLVSPRSEPPTVRVEFFEMERELLRRAASLQGGHNEAAAFRQDSANHASHMTGAPFYDPLTDMDISASSSLSSVSSDRNASCALSGTLSVAMPASSSLSSVRPLLNPIDIKSAVPHSTVRPVYGSQLSASPLASASSIKSRYKASHTSSPDPLVDISRLRVRSQGHHCLYPGATFQGTQKSGRNSYDVNVTIVDVDFASSHLCGYLRIRGLTDDWPELTTYFDAEIIGSRYGFLTRNWGASEQEDMVHWARFPAFRHVRHELKKPHLTMKDGNRGAVFMRWKEKFLVPDHRVQDINGASFAGFYYVCVDFNPQQSGSSVIHSPQSSTSPEASSHFSSSQPTAKPELNSRARRASINSGARRSGRSQSRGFPPAPVATMSGFYFHQNSEPYQQLSLIHVPEHTTSCFEFR